MQSKQPQVLVVGDVMLDRTLSGTATRLSPERPVPVLREGAWQSRPGGAANVAANLAAMGVTPYLLGAIGDDAEGAALQQLLSEADVHACLLKTLGQTTTKTRIVADGHQLVRLDRESGGLNHETALATAMSVIEGVQAVVFSDYAKGFLNPELVYHILGMALSRSLPVFVDTKPANALWYTGASLYKLNLAEALETLERLAVIHPAAFESPLNAAEWAASALVPRLRAGAVVVTAGVAGAAYASDGNWSRSWGADVAPVADVAGAGDTVLAALVAAGFREHYGFETLQWAVAAAGLAVRQVGTAVVDAVSIDDAVCQQQGAAGKVLRATQAIQQAAGWQARGQKVVLTSGCFDGLHAGHIELLRRASAYGDRLLVWVNDDASLQQLKGPDRPYVPQAARLLHLAQLADVDRVMPFDGDVRRLLGHWRPDVYVKGEDALLAGNVPGADYLVERGARVEFVPMYPVGRPAHSSNLFVTAVDPIP